MEDFASFHHTDENQILGILWIRTCLATNLAHTGDRISNPIYNFKNIYTYTFIKHYNFLNMKKLYPKWRTIICKFLCAFFNFWKFRILQFFKLLYIKSTRRKLNLHSYFNFMNIIFAFYKWIYIYICSLTCMFIWCTHIDTHTHTLNPKLICSLKACTKRGWVRVDPLWPKYITSQTINCI